MEAQDSSRGRRSRFDFFLFLFLIVGRQQSGPFLSDFLDEGLSAHPLDGRDAASSIEGVAPPELQSRIAGDREDVREKVSGQLSGEEGHEGQRRIARMRLSELPRRIEIQSLEL